MSESPARRYGEGDGGAQARLSAGLRVVHTGTRPVHRLRLADAERQWQLGHVSFADLGRVDCQDGPPTPRRLTVLVDEVATRSTHLCSSGTPVPPVARDETLFDHYYSYSFGCCRERNLILGALARASGFSVTALRARDHVALEASTTDGPYCADADQWAVARGPLDRLAAADVASFGLLRRCRREPVPDPRDTGKEWTMFPGDEIAFGMNQPEDLVYNPLQPHAVRACLDADPAFVADRSRGTCAGEARLALEPRCADAGRDRRGPWSVFELDSPFVMLSASIEGLPPGSRVSAFVDEGRGAVEALLQAPAFRLDSLSLGTVTRPIDAGEIHALWGGHARNVNLLDLHDRILTDTLQPLPRWFRDHSLRLFEDDRELGPVLHGPDPGRTGHERDPVNQAIAEQGHGRFRLYQQGHLVFSSSDGTDPRTNGRRYVIRVTAYRSLYEAWGRYRLRCRVRHQRPLPGDARFRLRFQYNRAIMPDWSGAAVEADAAGVTALREQ